MDNIRFTVWAVSILLVSSSRIKSGRSLTSDGNIILNLSKEFSDLDWHQKVANEIILLPIDLIERELESLKQTLFLSNYIDQITDVLNNSTNNLYFKEIAASINHKFLSCLFSSLQNFDLFVRVNLKIEK